MMPTHDGWFWILATLQLAGLMSCISIRLIESGHAARWCRPLFFSCLICIGVTTICAMVQRSPHWTTSGATLSLLSLAATFDTRGSLEPGSF